MVDHRPTTVTGRARGRGCDVVAGETRYWYVAELFDPDASRKESIVLDNGVVLRLIVIDQIHLVHGKDDVLNADQMGQVAMPTRLRQNSLARIDQNHRKIGCRSAGHH